MKFIVAQITEDTKKAIMQVVQGATGNKDRDSKEVKKIRAFIPFKEKLIEFFKPLGTKADYEEYIEEIQEHYDAKLRNALGEEAFQEASRDPNRYCMQLISDFYTRHPDYFLGVNEKATLVDAILHAVRNGIYAREEFKAVGFSRQWLMVFKPILGEAAFKRLEAKLTDVSDGE